MVVCFRACSLVLVVWLLLVVVSGPPCCGCHPHILWLLFFFLFGSFLVCGCLFSFFFWWCLCLFLCLLSVPFLCVVPVPLLLLLFLLFSLLWPVCVLPFLAFLLSLLVAAVLAFLLWFPLCFVGFPLLRCLLAGGVFLWVLAFLPLFLPVLVPVLLLPVPVGLFLLALPVVRFGFLSLPLRLLLVCLFPLLGFLLVLARGLLCLWLLALVVPV